MSASSRPSRTRFEVCALLACAAIGLACGTAGSGLRGRTISVSGDYVHPATQVRLPDRLDALERTAVIASDGNEANVGVVYAGAGSEITVHLYPAGEATAGRLRNEFLRARTVLEQGALVSMIDRTRIVRAPRPDGRAVGFESELRLMVEPSGVTDHVLLQVFQCGRFFLQVHAKQAAGATQAMRPDIDRVHELVPCQEIARRQPVGGKLRVGIDPEVLTGATDRSAEWIAHGFAQLEWIESHVPKEDLVFGIPDHDPALYLSAWEKTLSLRDQLSRKGEAFPNPFLDRLLQVYRAGYLEEYVWAEYLGFLDPSPELRPRLDRFARWRDARLPQLRHEVHAAAQLPDASE